MIDLTNLEEIRKLDPKDVYGSTNLFIEQCKQIHDIVDLELEGSAQYYNNQNLDCVVFSGMGGSAYGGHVAVSLFKDELSIPAIVNNDYGLPLFVNCDSLVILTSYSGNTEETLASYDESKIVNAHTIGLTSGGELAKKMENESEGDLVIFDPKNNPSGQPRLGTGYIVLGTIEILRNLGFLKIAGEEILAAVNETEKNIEKVKKNAMELSKKIFEKIPLILTGSIFEGNAHIIRNQFNETAKSFSSFHVIPEANHHAMEGFKNPKNKKFISLFLDSDLYSEKIKKRIELTKEVVQKNNIDILSYKASGKSKLSQCLEFLAFGGYLTFYLSLLYGQDPSLIPWVDYFKEHLNK